MTQSVITSAFETYLADRLQAGEPTILDEMVLAYIPDLDLQQPIDRAQGLPPVGQIVHRQPIDQTGRVNTNAVVYSVVMDATVGDFDFNALYLVNSATDMVAMAVHKETEQKIKTAGASVGNSLVKSLLMEYDGAVAATQINVDAGTWQIDFSARLRGMDEDLKVQAQDHYGPAAFHDGAFAVTAAGGNDYSLAPGRAYIGGLRTELVASQSVTVPAKPATIYADVYHAGSLLSDWDTMLTIAVSINPLADYIDGAGYQHRVAPVARVEVDGTITDLRGRGGLWWHERRPTAHTKDQVGLDKLDNFATASQAEAEGGSKADRFMTPLRSKQLADKLIQAHKGETNPHTKDQVGMDKVDNFATASQAEAEAGSKADRFMTPLRVKQAIAKLVPATFPAGTRMLFQQTSAPAGWVKETASFNNHALRVVTGTAGNGGGTDFTAAFTASRATSESGEHNHPITVNNHTLTLSQIPAHKHGGYVGKGSYSFEHHQYNSRMPIGSYQNGTDSAGGGQPHSHGGGSGLSGKHSHTLKMDVKYVDIIIATKQ